MTNFDVAAPPECHVRPRPSPWSATMLRRPCRQRRRPRDPRRRAKTRPRRARTSQRRRNAAFVRGSPRSATMPRRRSRQRRRPRDPRRGAMTRPRRAWTSPRRRSAAFVHGRRRGRLWCPGVGLGNVGSLETRADERRPVHDELGRRGAAGMPPPSAAVAVGRRRCSGAGPGTHIRLGPIKTNGGNTGMPKQHRDRALSRSPRTARGAASPPRHTGEGSRHPSLPRPPPRRTLPRRPPQAPQAPPGSPE